MKKSILTIIGLLVSSVFIIAMGKHKHGDAPSVHGMLLFGEKEVYISHLPMFHTPHNYQAIASVVITNEIENIFLKSQSDDPSENIYTIVPEVFVLPEVMIEGASFKAKIFKGHFERGGQAISGLIDFKISKIIYFKQLMHDSAPLKDSSYLLFGFEHEMFAAHIISSRPDFDQIVEVEPSNSLAEHIGTSAAVRIIFPNADNENPIEQGLIPDAKIETENGFDDIEGIKVKKIIYTEFNDLSF